MPPVLAPVIASAAGAAGFTFSTTAVTIASYAISTAAVVGLDYAANALASGTAVDVKQNFKQALPARVRAYGYCKLGGPFYMAYANGTLVQGFVHCEGPIYRFVEWWLGDVQATGIASGSLSGTSGVVPGKNKLFLDSQLGTADQVSNPGMTALLPSWGPSRRLAGLANTVMRCTLPGDPAKNFQLTYPSGAPALRVVVQAAMVYDSRPGTQSPTDPSTWTWSENAGLIIRDYLVHPDGAALPLSRLDEASFAAFASVCDQLIARADGTNEPRYRIGQGTYDLTEKKADVLRRFLAACDGEIYGLADGTIGIRGGVWTDPTVTITSAMIKAYTYQAGPDVLSAYNQLRIRYIDVNLDYQQVEGDPWDDTVAQAASGTVVPQDFDARVVPGYNQARRLAKIAMAKQNPRHLLTLECTMAALDAFGERIVMLELEELGLARTFYVSGFSIAGDCSGCTITLASLDATAYQWDTSQEGNPAPNVNVTVSYTIDDVTGLALSLVRTAVTGGVNAAQIQAVVTAPLDPSLTLHAQYRVSGTTDWTDMTGNGQWSAISGIVNDGTTYDVQAAFVTFGGEDGTFAVDTIDVEVDTVAPGVPTGLTAAVSAGAVNLDAIGPNVASLYALRFYRGTGTGFAGATLIATVYGPPGGAYGFVDSPAPSGTNHYWATAINHSAVASAPAGPVVVTV